MVKEVLFCGPYFLSHELSAVNMILPGLAACGCWVASGQARGAQYGTERVPVWLSAGRAGCLQVRSGSGVQTKGAAAWGLGWTWSLDTLNGIDWQLSRSDIHLLGFQASLGSSAGSMQRAAPGGCLALQETCLLPSEPCCWPVARLGVLWPLGGQEVHVTCWKDPLLFQLGCLRPELSRLLFFNVILLLVNSFDV